MKSRFSFSNTSVISPLFHDFYLDRARNSPAFGWAGSGLTSIVVILGRLHLSVSHCFEQ